MTRIAICPIKYELELRNKESYGMQCRQISARVGKDAVNGTSRQASAFNVAFFPTSAFICPHCIPYDSLFRFKHESTEEKW